MPGPEQLPVWKTLTALAQEAHADSPTAAWMISAAGLTVDFTKQLLSPKVIRALLQLAAETGIPAAREQLFNGATINNTEGRAVLHTSLRGEPSAPFGHLVTETRERLSHFARDVRSGEYRGFSGKSIRTVVHIGIGGSHLGPELAVEALAASQHGLRCRFVANVDGHALARVLAECQPETTLFVVVSKSFGTLETHVNANWARTWFLERVGDHAALARHFIAVSANVRAAQDFGIDAERIYPLWDWVGGRFSLWSAVGLPILFTAGPKAFDEMLAGARAMDRHFRESEAETNVPLLMALVGFWNYLFRHVESLAILPYDQRLRLLPSYLQQLEMESNGKSVHKDGTPCQVPTMPIVWGGEGTNGQHAFHQLLHQGTRSFAADFIAVAAPGHALEEHHRWLLANALAQSQAMLLGQDAEDPHRAVIGRKPSTLILLDALTPARLGALLALYEHKVFCQGVLWNINSFDQWGVEIGKRLALPIFDQLAGASAEGQDASTRALIEVLRSDPA